MDQVLGLREAILEGGISQKLKKHVFTQFVQQLLHSMYHRNYACVCGPQGLELTETHLVE
jgi:hypothetical protein